MSPQERSLLESFLAQLVQVRSVNKDPEAQRLIARAVEQQPDATYLVVQRSLLLDRALEQAKARIAELEEAGRGQGFLDPNASGWGNPGPSSGVAPEGAGRGYGGGGPAAGGPGAAVGRGGVPGGGVPGYGAPAYGAPVYGAPAYGAAPVYPAYGAPPVGGGFSSFLGQAAATAAGIAGGEFLFQGIENMFGHHGGGFAGGGFGGFGGGGVEAVPTEDVTINNYYAPEEVIVDNDFTGSPSDDDSDETFTSDDFSDDQDVV
jgi:uncharacterized protein